MAMYKYRSLISAFSAIFCVVVAADNCTTPNGDTAICISIHKCPVLLEAIKTEEPVTTKFAKQSQCGYDKVPLVCCGQSSNFTYLATDLLPSRNYCGFQHSDDYETHRVYGKGTTSIDEFPWLAALFYRTNGTEKNLCVGSLINERYVLTAAQCLPRGSSNVTLTSVRLGEYNIEVQDDCINTERFGSLGGPECSEKPTDFGVEAVVVHELYNAEQHEHDIGLIRLNSSVEYSDYIRPICLPLLDTARAKVGDKLAETGWGRTALQGNNVPRVKKKISTKLISNAVCSNIYRTRHNYTIRKGQVCTKDILSDSIATCQGNSGGPVMFSYKKQWSQEGIVSFGGGCGTGHPDVHVKVADYVNWIIKNLRA